MDYDEAKKYLYETGSFDKTYTIGICKLYDAITDDEIHKGIQLIQELTNCDDDTAKLLWVDLKCDFGMEENNPVIQARKVHEQQKLAEEYKLRNNAECPYCHSKNTKKITTTRKVVNTAVWGIFGTKRFKEWHCNNCGSDF